MLASLFLSIQRHNYPYVTQDKGFLLAQHFASKGVVVISNWKILLDYIGKYVNLMCKLLNW